MNPDLLSILNSAVGMICGALITGIAAFLIGKIKAQKGIPERLKKTEDIGLLTLRILRRVLEIHEVHMGILAGNKINGNVQLIREKISISEQEVEQFFDRLAAMGIPKEDL
jgi:hypothetical protein